MSTLLEKIAKAKRAAQPKLPSIPKGHLTARQWAEKWGLKESRTRALLLEGVRAGIMKMVIHKTPCVMGYARDMPHYYEVK